MLALRQYPVFVETRKEFAAIEGNRLPEEFDPDWRGFTGSGRAAGRFEIGDIGRKRSGRQTDFRTVGDQDASGRHARRLQLPAQEGKRLPKPLSNRVRLLFRP